MNLIFDLQSIQNITHIHFNHKNTPLKHKKKPTTQ